MLKLGSAVQGAGAIFLPLFINIFEAPLLFFDDRQSTHLR